jgi:hypothetical protein
MKTPPFHYFPPEKEAPPAPPRRPGPEDSLLAFIDDVLFAEDPVTTWVGSAKLLSRQLRGSKHRREVAKLLSWPDACGTYLGRLARQKPERVKRKRTNANRDWIIRPPNVTF